MSRDEAKQLLDSLKSDDRKMPLAPAHPRHGKRRAAMNR